MGRLSPLLLLIALLLVPSTVLGSSGNFSHDGPSGGPSAAVSTPNAPALISKGPFLGDTPSTFWSLDLQTNQSSGVWTDPTVRSFLSQTPFNWVRYGELTEECNITSNTLYAPNGTTVAGGCLYNLTAFRLWCLSRTPRCHAVLPLPGENNNSAEDAYIARWIVRTLGFQPDYWSVGNEPSGWKHYGIPWTNWSASDNSTPTPLAYALDLQAAITAVRAVDPAARFMGLEAACACERPIWYQEVIRVDGARIAAIGYHSYPWGGSYNETLGQFYGALNSTTNIPSTYARVRADIAHQCARCATLPIFLHEYNAGPGAGHTNFSGGYANAVFLAASVAQALRANVTQFTIFNLQSNLSTFGYAMINRTNVVGPTGILFEDVLSRWVEGRVFGTNVSSPVPGLWSVLSVGPGRSSFLLVNTNLTQSVTVGTRAVFTPGSNSTFVAWSPGHRFPTVSYRTLQANYTVGPEGILLLTVPSHSIHGVRPPPATGTAQSAASGGRAAPVFKVPPPSQDQFVVSACPVPRASEPARTFSGNVMGRTGRARPP